MLFFRDAWFTLDLDQNQGVRLGMEHRQSSSDAERGIDFGSR
jgi:hypothetical protein